MVVPWKVGFKVKFMKTREQKPSRTNEDIWFLLKNLVQENARTQSSLGVNPKASSAKVDFNSRANQSIFNLIRLGLFEWWNEAR